MRIRTYTYTSASTSTSTYTSTYTYTYKACIRHVWGMYKACIQQKQRQHEAISHASWLPPGTTKRSTSYRVFSLVKCFATARYHEMDHLTSCFEFGLMLCYRQVPQNSPPHILLSIWSNAVLPPSNTKWTSKTCWINMVSTPVVLLSSFHWKTTLFVQHKAPPTNADPTG